MWLGASDQDEPGVWKWVDDTVLEEGDYQPWYPNEPNHDYEHCMDMVVAIFPPGTPGQWNDNNCTILQDYICERQMLDGTEFCTFMFSVRELHVSVFRYNGN